VSWVAVTQGDLHTCLLDAILVFQTVV